MQDEEPQPEPPLEPELRFGAPTEQEVERSRNLKLILVLLVGPFAVLLYLGYDELAVGVLITSFIAAFYVVRVLDRMETIEDAGNPTELSLRDEPSLPRRFPRTGIEPDEPPPDLN